MSIRNLELPLFRAVHAREAVPEVVGRVAESNRAVDASLNVVLPEVGRAQRATSSSVNDAGRNLRRV